MPVLLRLALACLLLLVCGCTLHGGRTADTAGSSSRETLRMFTPMSESGVKPLSDSEARALFSQWSPSLQRLDSRAALDDALSQSQAFVGSKPAGSVALNRPGLRLTYGRLAASLGEMRRVLPQAASRPEILAEHFRVYRIGPDFGVTGYYEPTLQASRTRTATYCHPLYRVPRDLRDGVPYYTRNAIDRHGALAGKNLEIAWVDDDVDAFFLHIQGSGRLRFQDGTFCHVLYAGKNNRSYVPLGRVMRDQGLLAPDDISMHSIRRVLDENPSRKAELFDTNPSYVFFREASKGPIGGMGRPLTPWASLAVDRSVLPHGTLCFLSVPLPDDSGNHVLPFNGVTLPQDTGGAIKGNRIDLFCGPGDFAAHTAGYLNTKGAVYVLVKK